MAIHTQQHHLIDVGFALGRRSPRNQVMRLTAAVMGPALDTAAITGNQANPLLGSDPSFGAAVLENSAGFINKLYRKLRDAPVVGRQRRRNQPAADQLDSPCLEHLGIVGQVCNV